MVKHNESVTAIYSIILLVALGIGYHVSFLLYGFNPCLDCELNEVMLYKDMHVAFDGCYLKLWHVMTMNLDECNVDILCMDELYTLKIVLQEM